jgi:hypothetical protein
MARRQRSTCNIPVLGPIPGLPPLVIGSEMVLSQPTPLQWHTLQEARYQHEAAEHAKTSVHIDAAPLVAIMDDATARSLPRGQRYATLAAVIGWSYKDRKKQDADSTQSSSASFLLEGDIKLLGIGRAALHDFFHRRPHSLENDDLDDEGYLLEDEDEQLSSSVNILMANFELLQDMEMDPEKNVYASPVHTLAHLSNVAQYLNNLHQQRLQLVSGLRAGQARLRLQNLADEDLVDHDGIGLICNGIEVDWDTLLKDSSNDDGTLLSLENLPEECVIVPDEKSTFTSYLAQWENYGMGYSATSLSGLSQRTLVVANLLAPYYSPTRRESEEFALELLSFVSIQSMQPWLTAAHISWALSCTSTAARLQQAADWMQVHVQQLKQEAEAMQQALQECGEECMDLW